MYNTSGIQNSSRKEIRILGYAHFGQEILNRKDSNEFEKKFLRTFDIVSMPYINELLLSIVLNCFWACQESTGCSIFFLVCQHFLRV